MSFNTSSLLYCPIEPDTSIMKIYFNTCSTAPLAIPVREGIKKFLDQWNEQGGLSWLIEDGWTDTIEKARSLFAKLINAKPEEIAYSFGNSVALSSVTSAIPFNSGDEIVFNELDFPATATHSMAKKESNLNYKVVKSTNGISVNPEDYKTVINTKTKLITACHVVSNTGFKMDINHLIELAHEKDIPVFIDAYQSMGNIPIDVNQLDVDFLASGCLKWLLGGFGISFLYIRKDKIEELNPSSIGWMGVEDPFDDLYDKLRTKLHRPSDATKFQYGTGYPIGAFGAYEGMKIVDDEVQSIRKFTEEDSE